FWTRSPPPMGGPGSWWWSIGGRPRRSMRSIPSISRRDGCSRTTRAARRPAGSPRSPRPSRNRTWSSTPIWPPGWRSGRRAGYGVVGRGGRAEAVAEEYPVYLTTGRVLAPCQSGAQTRRIAPLTAAEPEPDVELHPDLAARLEIGAGDRVRVTSRRGRAGGVARISDAIRSDTVFMPFHWEGTNLLTNPELDPTSRMLEFKVCAVRVERAR